MTTLEWIAALACLTLLAMLIEHQDGPPRKQTGRHGSKSGLGRDASSQEGRR